MVLTGRLGAFESTLGGFGSIIVDSRGPTSLLADRCNEINVFRLAVWGFWKHWEAFTLQGAQSPFWYTFAPKSLVLRDRGRFQRI